MKLTFALLAASALLSAGIPQASAGDREWATAGKVLTGLFAAKVIHDIAQPRHVVVRSQPPVYYYQPAPVVVAQPHVIYVQQPVTPQPQIIYVQPQQVVVQQQAIQVQPAPVYVQTAPAGPVFYVQSRPVGIYVQPAPVYTYGPVCRPRVFIGARW